MRRDVVYIGRVESTCLTHPPFDLNEPSYRVNESGFGELLKIIKNMVILIVAINRQFCNWIHRQQQTLVIMATKVSTMDCFRRL